MTRDEFKNLSTGDIVRGVASTHAFVVLANYGDRVTAVDIADLTNPDEWNLMFKAEHVRAAQE